MCSRWLHLQVCTPHMLCPCRVRLRLRVKVKFGVWVVGLVFHCSYTLHPKHIKVKKNVQKKKNRSSSGISVLCSSNAWFEPFVVIYWHTCFLFYFSRKVSVLQNFPSLQQVLSFLFLSPRPSLPPAFYACLLCGRTQTRKSIMVILGTISTSQRLHLVYITCIKLM
ncbi:unnamed protein product [Discosporangium mesarthrocarpum]